MWRTAGVISTWEENNYSKPDFKPPWSKFLIINTDIISIPLKYTGKTFSVNLVNMVINPTSNILKKVSSIPIQFTVRWASTAHLGIPSVCSKNCIYVRLGNINQTAWAVKQCAQCRYKTCWNVQWLCGRTYTHMYIKRLTVAIYNS